METEVAIVGGGVVGASFAAASRGLQAVLVAPERREARAARAEDPFEARVYAITPGNAAFLRDIGAWQKLSPARIAPVHAMRVYGDDGESSLEFDAYRSGVAELAWIVEDGALQDALWASLAPREGLDILAPAQCDAIAVDDQRARLRLRDGRALSAKLVVGADGARSFVRGSAGIEARERAYGQTAVVANFSCERPHRQVARQWFQGGAVLALLPLPGDRISMVWSVDAARAERLVALEARALCREVADASRRALGEFRLLGGAQGYPLRRLAAQRMVAPRLALLGDAAHVVHPLAGQGANLGLQDARELAAVLAAREPGRDPGDLRLLRRYERARAEPTLLMDRMVHGLYRLFGASGAPVARLRNFGLNLTDGLPVLKNVLMRQAMR